MIPTPVAERPSGDDSPAGAADQRDRLSTGAGHAGSGRTRLLLIGAGPLADATESAQQAAEAAVPRLEERSDRDIRDALDERIDRIVAISRSTTCRCAWPSSWRTSGRSRVRVPLSHCKEASA